MPMIIDQLPNTAQEQIAFIDQYYTTNLSHFIDKLQHLKETPEGSIALAKIYFSIQEYDEAINLVIANKEYFVDDNSFFSKRILFHIFDNFVKYKSFIMEYISKNPSPDDEIYFRMHNLVVKREPKNNYERIDLLVQGNDQEGLINLIGSFNYPENYNLIYYIYENFPLKRTFFADQFALLYKKDPIALKLLDCNFYREIQLDLLLKNNKTNFEILKGLNKHNNKLNALLMNAIFNLGTSNDSVYRETKNILDVSGWNKYLGLGLIGVIHQNFVGDIYNVLKEFMPSDSELKNGGALLAIGLSRQNNSDDTEFISSILSDPNITGELAYGAILSLAINNAGSNSQLLNQLIIKKLEQSENFLKEPCLLALGLINLGSKNQFIIDLLTNYFFDDTFDRISRNAGLAIALLHMNYCKLENYSVSINSQNYIFSLLDSFNPTQKYSATLIAGSFYFATGNFLILEKLLKLCSDTDENVRRGAVFAIGMVCCLDERLLIDTLLLIGSSHCPRVRGAVAITFGVFLGGKTSQYYMKEDFSLKRVIDLMEVMLYDENNLVIQQSSIGLGMLLSQSNSTIVQNYKRIVERINSLCLERDDNLGTKLGACIGRSLLGLAGETGVISVLNQFNKPDPKKMMGALVFYNYYFNYQLLPFISLCVKNNGIIILDENLTIKESSFLINEKRSKFQSENVKSPDKKQKRFKKKEIKLEYFVEEEGSYEVTNVSKLSYGEMMWLEMDRLGVHFG